MNDLADARSRCISDYAWFVAGTDGPNALSSRKNQRGFEFRIALVPDLDFIWGYVVREFFPSDSPWNPWSERAGGMTSSRMRIARRNDDGTPRYPQ